MKSSSFGYFKGDLGNVLVSPEIVRSAVLPEIENAENLDFASRKRENDVTLEFADGKVIVNLAIAVALDVPIHREAMNIQASVLRSVQAVTGLEVSRVNVKVERVFEKEMPKEAPAEAEKGNG